VLLVGSLLELRALVEALLLSSGGGLDLPVLDLLLGSLLLGIPESLVLGAPLGDLLNTGSDDGTLDLVDPPGPLLENGLTQSLLVLPPPGLGPHELGRLLPLLHESPSLGRSKGNGPAVTADEKHSISGVDTVVAESAQLGLDNHSALGEGEREGTGERG